MKQYEVHNQRMRQNICEAMYRILLEVPFSKITVQSILQEAHIQRATFYRYFRDKFEVAEAINQQLSDSMAQAYMGLMYDGVSPYSELPALLEPQNRQLLGVMIRLRMDNLDLPQTLRSTFQSCYRRRFPDCGPYEADLAGASFLAFTYWFVEKSPTREEIATILSANVQARWLARLYGVPADRLLSFLAEYGEKGEEREDA